MTWTTPFTAVVGATITAAGHNTSIRDNLLHLRGLLPDAGGSGYWLVSSSTTAAAFVARATEVLTALGFTPVNKAGDTMSGGLTLNAGGTLANSQALSAKEAGGTARSAVIMGNDDNLYLGDSATDLRFRTLSEFVVSVGGGGFTTVWHAGNDGSGSGLDADTVDGSHASAFALAAAGVPSGLIALVTNAAAIPTGWTRESLLDGRIPVADDSGSTFTSENNYGAAWSHVHTGPSHSHGASALGVSGTTAASGSTNGLGNNGGVSVNTTGHQHTEGTLDVTGNTDAAGTGNTGSTSHMPLMRAYVYVKKD